MERRLGTIALGLLALALTLSSNAQQSDPKDQLGEADAQERQPSYHERDASERSEALEAVRETQAEGKQVDPASTTADPTGQASDVRAATGSQALRQLAVQYADLTAFVQALENTGLATILAQGKYTAFAPTNAAFESAGIDPESLDEPAHRQRLMALLRNHIVAESVAAAQAKTLDHAVTLGGGTVALSDANGEFKVNDAKVVETDLRAGNLIVHTIDRVLEPAPDSTPSASHNPAAPGSRIAIPGESREDAGMPQESGGAPQVASDDDPR